MSKNSNTEKIIKYFNSVSENRSRWLKKSRYFHKEDLFMFKELIPKNSKVLEIGCGNGHLIGNLSVDFSVGIDISEKLIQKARVNYPKTNFHSGSISEIKNILDKKVLFDYIIVCDTIGYLNDIQDSLNNLHSFCNTNTRLIVGYFSPMWSPILSMAQYLRLKMPDLNPPLFSTADIKNFLRISNFKTLRVEKKIILPYSFLGLGKITNRLIANIPLFSNLCLRQYLVARSINQKNKFSPKSASIIIPCRNEYGNIREIIKRIPRFSKNLEVIFVEGNSKDKTWQEIQSILLDNKLCKGLTVKAFKQDGHGKKNAVIKGFDNATKEVLIILDCDMTVPPESLLKFWEKISNGDAEFVNGSRLIYPMKQDAMRFLNYIANKVFSHLFSWILGQKYTDTLCGTKVISKYNYFRLKKISKDLNQLDPFGDFYLIFGSSRLSLEMVEIPIRYEARSYGETQISRFKDGLKLLKMILSIQLQVVAIKI